MGWSALGVFSTGATSFGAAILLDSAGKGTVILLGAWMTAVLLRRASAAFRHLVWFLGITSLLLLPVCSWLLPTCPILPRWLNAYPVPVPEEAVASARGLAGRLSGIDQENGPARPGPAAPPAPARPALEREVRTRTGLNDRISNPLTAVLSATKAAGIDPGAGVLLIWLAGLAIALTPLAAELISLRYLRHTARRMADPTWHELANASRATLKLRRPIDLFTSDRRRIPMTWGCWMPRLLLPQTAESWTESQRRLVLLHELAHIKRWDCATNLLTQLVCAIYWFNPLVWLAARHLSLEQERASDDWVLNTGAEAPEYARQVLRVAAGAARRTLVASPAIAMARTGGLEQRLLAILDANRNRKPLGRAAGLGALAGLIAFLGPVAMLRGVAPPEANTPPAARAASVEPDAAEKPTVPAQPRRVLHLPDDRSLGELYLQDAEATVLSPVFLDDGHPSSWQYWGPARGTVALPAGKSVRLVVRNLTALNDLSPLAALAPDDLTELSVSGNHNPRHAGDLILPHLRGLSGLKVLVLNLRDLTPKAMSGLRELRALQRLWIHTYPRSAQPEPGSPSRQLDDACLEVVAGLRSLESLSLSSHEMTDRSLTHLTELAHLRDLDLWSPKIQGPGLASLERLPALRRLRLGGLEISDQLLRPLAGLKSLRTLDLRYVKITDAGGMACLRQLDQLEDLTLWGTASGAQGLAHLQLLHKLKHLDLAMGGPNPVRPGDPAAVALRELSSLERLRLVDFDFSDVGLAQLAQLPNLRSLELDSGMELDPQTNRVYYSDSGLRALRQLRHLERLVAGSPRITDEGLASVAQCPRLKDLELAASGVSNDGLRHLAALASLESLSLSVPKVTISGLNHLNALTNLLRLQLRFIRQDNRGLNLSRLRKLEDFELTMRRYLEAGRWPRVEEVRDRDVAWLSGIKGLRSLHRLCGVSDAGLKQVRDLTALERLTIGGPGVTDAGLACLANLKNLHQLILNGDLTGDGLGHLEGLPSLKVLYLESLKNIRPEALSRLRQTKPDLQVFYERLPFGGGG